jgi:hypothetical protein
MDKPIKHPAKQNRIVITHNAANTTHGMATPNQFTRLPILLRQEFVSPFILLPLLLVARRDFLRWHIDRLIPHVFGRPYRGEQRSHSERGDRGEQAERNDHT